MSDGSAIQHSDGAAPAPLAFLSEEAAVEALRSTDERVREQARQYLYGKGPPDKPSRKVQSIFTRADKLLEHQEPISWLIEGWLPDGAIGGLVGPSGSGKSFLALDWACAIATAQDWFGARVKPRPVFYLAGEGQRGLSKRLRAWSLYHKVSLAKFPLFISRSVPPLATKNPDNVSMLIDQIDMMREEAEDQPGLIVIDTVARALLGSNENSSEDMGRLVGSMDALRDRYGCAVLAVHHTGHAEQARARGSSAFYAALDAEFQITKLDNTLTLRSTKAKDWEAPEDISLRLSVQELDIRAEDGELEASLVITGSTAYQPTKAEVRQQAIELLSRGTSVRLVETQTGMSKSAVQRLKNELSQGQVSQ